MRLNTDNLPPESKVLPNWALWKKETTKDGKLAKVPYQPNGEKAKSSDSSTWMKFDTACLAYQDIGGFDGICWMMPTEPGDLVFIDIDHCIKDGEIEPWAQKVVDEFDSYTETSQSEEGLHILIRGKKPFARCRVNGSPYEIYDHLRPCYLTGDVVGDHKTIEARQEPLNRLFKELFGEEKPEDTEPQKEATKGESTLSDTEVIAAMLGSRKADEIEALLRGDTSAHNGDDSAADIALCNHLAFFCGRDQAQMDRIFRSSKLMRPKWDSKRGPLTYGEGTIRKACAGTKDTYRPPKEPEKWPKADEPKPDPERAPLRFEDVCDITLDKDGDFKTSELSPTKAAKAVCEKLYLAMTEGSTDIYRWDGQIYRTDGARIIDAEMCRLAGDDNDIKKLKEILRRVSNRLLETPVEFEPNPYLLGVKNGVVDLRTGEFRNYRPEDLLLEQADIIYDPNAKCPAILGYLEGITPDPTTRIMLIDWFAATAIREPLPYVLFLLGLGRNGKGIYEKLIKRFFGRAAFRDMPLQEVEKNNFAASGFYRKRGWIASETGKRKSSIGTDFIKLTSGNGVIDGDRKNQSRIQFEPYFQTIVDTNTMPQIDDNSRGWEERFCKGDLPYTFLQTPDPDNPLEKQIDPHLFEKLSTPGELSGMLNLVILRAKEVAKTKTITKRSGKEMFSEYADQSSSVGTFLELFCEYLEAGPDVRMPVGTVYDRYKEWCGYKVGEVVDQRYFGKLVKDFCGGIACTVGKDDDRKSIRIHKRLNFDSCKCTAAIEALKERMSTTSLQESTSSLQGDSSTDSVVYMSTCNMWNDIIKRFGDNNSKSLYTERKLKKHVEHVDNVDIDNKRPRDVEGECRQEVDKNVDKPPEEQSEPKCKDASIPKTPRFPGMKKRVCCLCGHKSSHDLTPYSNPAKGINGYICVNCHMHGPPAPPEEPNAQTTLESEA